jgi:hypothetical protein
VWSLEDRKAIKPDGVGRVEIVMDCCVRVDDRWTKRREEEKEEEAAAGKGK